ncbi:MAG TPA: hypothetical protein EYN69_01650, partial [Flavobacteriales bacterium]|nr:hypothetical protein [Flavobacteriales bacterium]
MSHFFLFLFNFFKKNRVAFAIFLISTVGFIAFFAPRISLEEDISKIIPRDEKVDKLNFIFQNSKFADKLVVNISLNDESGNAAPEKLIAFAAQLSDSLRNGSISEYISLVTDQVPEDLMYEVYNFLYENLPIFLTGEDYSRIDEMISPKAINMAMENNYKILVSPASMVLKSSLVRDPLGITNIPLKRLESFQFDDNFELYDGYILTSDRKNLLMFIQPQNSARETALNTFMLQGLDTLIEQLSRLNSASVSAEYFGGVAVAVGNALRIKKDVQLTVSIAVIVLLLFISWFFRKKTIFFIIILPVFIGGGIAVASLFLIKSTVSAIALGVGSVLLGITVDYSLHIVTHFRHVNSVRTLLKDVSAPILMSCLTTGSAFLCLMLVSSEALQDLGLFAAMSVISAALFSLIVLPHFLKEESQTPDRSNIVDAIASLQLHKSKIMIGIVLLISILCLFSYDKVEFESDMMKMNYMSAELAQSEKNLNQVSSASAKSIFLVSSANNLEEALQYNEQIIDRVGELKDNGLIRAYTSVGTLMLSEKLQQERIARWDSYWTAARSDSLKQRLIRASRPFHFRESAFSSFYELLKSDNTPLKASEFSAVRGLFLNDYITESAEQSTIVTLIKAGRENKNEIIETLSGFEGSVVFDREYLTFELIKILKKDFGLLVSFS